MYPFRALLFPVLVAAALMLAPRTAHAYIDPGTGSFVIQGIIAAVVGVGFAIKMFWHRIKAILTGRPLPTETDDED